MNRRQWLWVSLLVLGLPAGSDAQTVIEANRRTDWSGAGVTGGIPDRTTMCASLSPGATATQINSAIAACPAGQVVFLNAGTYTLSSGITFAGVSHVTLRGAGPDRTILVFTGSDGCSGLSANVCIRGSSTYGWGGFIPTSNIRTWTAGYAQGSTQITLDSTAGMTVGMVLALDQLDDVTDTGGILVSHSVVLENVTAGRVGRAQQQYVRVTAITGNQVTISPGLHMPNWRSSQLPQAWWWGSAATTAAANGIEDLTLDHTGSTETSGMEFYNAYQSWVRNVRSLNANRNHVWLWQAARIEIRDSYFYGTKNAASQSYGVESYGSSDDLVVNNIFHHVTAPIMMGPNTGSVFAYNYMIDMAYTNTNWMMAGIVGNHDVGTGMNLFEGNVANQFLMDLYHGPGALATLFRNRLTGRDGAKTGNTSVVNIWGYNRADNVVGNVLGTAGYHSVYEDSRTPSGTTGAPDRSIYLLGYSGVGETIAACCPYDALVVSTLLRWGNYDYATGHTRWNPAEIPAGHPVPATQTLPASLFLAGRPGWWGAAPWPPIGPDVTGGQDPAGHAHRIPAQVCFDDTPRNVDGTLAFNADSCYGTVPSSVPSAPTRLMVQ